MNVIDNFMDGLTRVTKTLEKIAASNDMLPDDLMTFAEFEKLDMVRDEVSKTIGYLVDLKFDSRSYPKKIASALDEILMATANFNEIIVELSQEE